MREINFIVLHCAATPNGRKFKAEDVERWHRERMDWGPSPSGKYTGYHWMIGINGEVWAGRLPNEVGVHAKGYNKNSFGIMLFGMSKYTPKQWDSLKNLLTLLMSEYPEAKVIGHNELSPKDCPGFDVQEYIENGLEPNEKNILDI